MREGTAVKAAEIKDTQVRMEAVNLAGHVPRNVRSLMIERTRSI
jgi:hypothetical protein